MSKNIDDDTCPYGYINTSNTFQMKEKGYSLSTITKLQSRRKCVPMPCKWYFPDYAFNSYNTNYGFFNDNNNYSTHFGCMCDYRGSWAATSDGSACVPVLTSSSGKFVNCKMLFSPPSLSNIYSQKGTKKINLDHKNVRSDAVTNNSNIASLSHNHRAVTLFFGEEPQTLHRLSINTLAPLHNHIQRALLSNTSRTKQTRIQKMATHSSSQYNVKTAKRNLLGFDRKDLMNNADIILFERGSINFTKYCAFHTQLYRSSIENHPFRTISSKNIPFCSDANDKEPFCREEHLSEPRKRYKAIVSSDKENRNFFCQINPRFAIENNVGGIWWKFENYDSVANKKATEQQQSNISVKAALLTLNNDLPDTEISHILE